jgi:hypothetical protein
MYRRKIKESLYIQQFDEGSLINDKMASVPLFCSVCPPIKVNRKVEFSLVFRSSGTGSPVSIHYVK